MGPAQKKRKLKHVSSSHIPTSQGSGSRNSTQVSDFGSLQTCLHAHNAQTDAIVIDSDASASSAEEEALELLDFSLWQYRYEDKKDAQGGPDAARVGDKRDHFDHLLFWGKNHKTVLRGRTAVSRPREHFFLHQVVLKTDNEGEWYLLCSAEQSGRPHEFSLEAANLDGSDRGFETIELLLDVASGCRHTDREACAGTCLERLKTQLDELYSSSGKWPASSADSRRSALLAMLHLVRPETADCPALNLLSETSSYGKHAASPLVHRLAMEAGLFEHSLACNGTLPYDCAPEPPLPRRRSRNAYFGDAGTRTAKKGCYRYEELRIESLPAKEGDNYMLDRAQCIQVGDFVAVDAPEGEWIARCISFRMEDRERLVHLQWFTRQDATTLYNGGGFLQNELFARAHCDDQPIDIVRGKLHVRILEPEERAPEEALASSDWIVRYAYDGTASGRLLPFVDRPLDNAECPACVEMKLHVEEQGEEDELPKPSSGTGDVLFRFQGVDYHRSDCVAYGKVDCTQLVQIHSYRSDSESIKARVFIRADLRNEISLDKWSKATSGDPISHTTKERTLFCVPGFFELPLVRNDEVLVGKDKYLLVNDLQPAAAPHTLETLPVLADPLRQPYDFVVTEYCGELSESIVIALCSNPDWNSDNENVVDDDDEQVDIEPGRGLDEEQRMQLRKALHKDSLTEAHEPIRKCSICERERNLASQKRDAFIGSTRSCSSKKLQILDVFGGFGGTALGILNALRALPLNSNELRKLQSKDVKRFRSDAVTLVAVDADKEAAATYQENLPMSRVHESDVDAIIRGLVSNPKARKDLLTSRPLDLLLLTPPCQAFSGMNRLRSVADHRAALVAAGLSFVEILRPKIVLIEEVPGLLEFTDVYRLLLRCFAALGYAIDSGVRCLSEYGLMQTRERCLIVATRLDCPKQCLLPPPTHERTSRHSRSLFVPIKGQRDLSATNEKIDLRHIMGLTILVPPLHEQMIVDDLPPFDWHLEGETLLPDGSQVAPASAESSAADFDDAGVHAAHARRQDARYGAGRVMGWSLVDYRRFSPANGLQRFFRTHHLTGQPVSKVTDHLTRSVTDAVIRAAYAAKLETHGPRIPHQLRGRARRATITTHNKVGKPVGGNQRRTVNTIRELMRDQGFPDSFVFPNETTVMQREKLVGNSVSPFLSFHIGLSILDTLAACPTRDVSSSSK